MKASACGDGGTTEQPRSALYPATETLRPPPGASTHGVADQTPDGAGYREAMAAYVPPAWPPAVAAPGSEDWESSAAAWLLDLLPEYREHPKVHRYPVVLASIAHHTLRGALEGARDGYRTVRTELGASPTACGRRYAGGLPGRGPQASGRRGCDRAGTACPARRNVQASALTAHASPPGSENTAGFEFRVFAGELTAS